MMLFLVIVTVVPSVSWASVCSTSSSSVDVLTSSSSILVKSYLKHVNADRSAVIKVEEVYKGMNDIFVWKNKIFIVSKTASFENT